LARPFYGVSTDSRQISKGNLFVALRGENFDGHDFLNAAILGGAAGLLIEEGAQGRLCRDDLRQITLITVDDTLQALGDVAHFWRRRFDIPIIGITGSAGKTTTKEIMAAICGLEKNIIKTEGNFNNLIGLPLTLLRMNEQHEAAVIEMGTNRPGEIGRLTRITEPHIGLITNVGPAHLEGLTSIDHVRQEKGEIFRNMAKGGIAVINLDDENTRKLGADWRGRKVTFSLRSAADVRARHIRHIGMDGMRFELVIGDDVQDVLLPLAGEHHVANALAAAAAARALGMAPAVIRRGLSSCSATAGRMEIRRLKNGSFLINDAYNANPLSVREAVKTLNALKGDRDGIVILGDMLELGQQAGPLHEDMGSFIADHCPAALFLKGDYATYTAKGACRRGLSKGQVFFFTEPREVLACLRGRSLKDAWILVKGSRRMKLDEVVRQICEAFGIEN
jgi:UDP-N-acetylmuramoyl-tripeptide--D-alanyl-D-alanine ligase